MAPPGWPGVRVPLAAILAIAAMALAGCSDGKPAPATPEAAPSTTGTLHGVVVDAAIRPLGNVQVRIEAAGAPPANLTTGDDGLWTFRDVPAGSVLVFAQRGGYLPSQTVALVLPGAGADSEGVRLVLDIDPAKVPAIDAYSYDGYLSCSATLVLVRQACDADEAARPVCEPTGQCGEGLSDDRFLAIHAVGRANITWLQSEVQWDGSGLGARLSAVPGAREPASGSIQDFEAVEGPSPLIVPLKGEVANALGIGAANEYALRVFSSDADGTRPPCAPSPVGCTFGVGLVTQQRFTVLTHVFYAFTPPEGWQFGRDGLPPVPAP